MFSETWGEIDRFTVGDYAARTDANGDGTKTLTLGKDSSQFQGLNMSVLLAHESERTGEWKGDAGQVANTNEAVVDHMMMAQQIEANYGSGSLNGDLAHQAEGVRNPFCVNGI